MLLLVAMAGLCLVGLGGRANGADDSYLIGTGRYDVTGPAAEIEMVQYACSGERAPCGEQIHSFSLILSPQMGYAMPTQITHGIHFRQWSRAFIIADSAASSRVVFVNVDICMGTQILKMQVSSQCNL